MTGLTSKEELITLTFYDSENTNILEVRFYNSSFYEQEVGDNKHYTPVPDLGDQAAIAIPDMPYRVTFLQGEHSIMMQSIPVDGDVPLTEEQLIQLAKIVVSRL
ncbi:MAG TPA: hypothetical protein VFC74_02380 [Oscillospiraceae bacterium]|nr:hypothetical protein [Oscillospiraceae bacterium]